MDKDTLIEQIAKEVIKRLLEKSVPKKILIVSNQENHEFDSLDYTVETRPTVVNPENYAYIILSAADYQAIHSAPVAPPVETNVSETIVSETIVSTDVYDLTRSKLIQERQIRQIRSEYASVKINAKAIITPLAADSIRSRGLKLIRTP